MKELTDEGFFQEAYKFDVKRLYGFAMVSAFRTISPKDLILNLMPMNVFHIR